MTLSPKLEATIFTAAQKTGVDPAYLRQTALRESSGDPSARAATSSAAGLFQFIEATWLETLERYGDKLGLQAPTPEGPDRDVALARRFDPMASALMAGALTRENANALESALGREPSAGELYAAHVLGRSGAVTLLSENPGRSAADVFPAAAAANRGLFYERNGSERTVGQLIARFETMMADAKDAGLSTRPVAAEPKAEELPPAWTARETVTPFGPAVWTPQPSAPATRLTPQVILALAALGAPETVDDDGRERTASRRDDRVDDT